MRVLHLCGSLRTGSNAERALALALDAAADAEVPSLPSPARAAMLSRRVSPPLLSTWTQLRAGPRSCSHQ